MERMKSCFLGTVHLELFEYKEMYLFALQAIESIAGLGSSKGLLKQ